MYMQLLSVSFATAVLALLLAVSASANPPNSYGSGASWRCQSGYKRVGNRCQRVERPANAYTQGSSWACKNGYKRVGNQCQKIEISANESVRHNKPHCAPGHHRVGADCQRTGPAPNAVTPGADWSCRDGYKRIGNACQKITVVLQTRLYTPGRGLYQGQRCAALIGDYQPHPEADRSPHASRAPAVTVRTG